MASYKLENVETNKLMSFEGECIFLYTSKPGHPYVYVLFQEMKETEHIIGKRDFPNVEKQEH